MSKSKAALATEARKTTTHYIKEFARRIQTADNPTGEPLANVQASLEHEIRQSGAGEAGDFQLKMLAQFASHVHRGRSIEEAAELVKPDIDRYGEPAEPIEG